MKDEERPAEFSAPEPSSDELAPTKPRRVDLRRLKREEKARKAEWHRTHIKPFEHLMEWGVPVSSLILYGRWWQFERWLRDLVQLELQSAYHAEWTANVAGVEKRRQNQTKDSIYMPSSDDSNPLGFADLGDLEELILNDWRLFEYALLPSARWTGLVSTLRAVRHRVGHCRLPHADDQSRVEQALRDLDSGARRCLRAYSSVDWVTAATDPHVASLLEGGEYSARIEHAYKSYRTSFRLHKSHRPWSDGTDGVLYHAHWHCGRWPPDVRRVWDYVKQAESLDLLLHLNFYAFNNVEAVVTPSGDSRSARLIDQILEAVLTSEIPQKEHDWCRSWPESIGAVDYRVHVDDIFAKASDVSQAASIFFWPEDSDR